jgi:hypothetical protein
MVSGGAALLLQSTPAMTPRHVKVALQITAQFMPAEGFVSAGTGSVNLHAARRAAGNDGLLGILTSLVGGSPVVGSGFAYLKPGAKLEQSNRVIGLIDARRRAWTGRTSNSMAALIIWGETNWWTTDQQMIWGDQLFNPAGQQMIWGDQTFGQQMIWGDQTTGQQMIWGDQTTGQQMIWGDGNYSNANQMIWGDSIPDGK